VTAPQDAVQELRTRDGRHHLEVLVHARAVNVVGPDGDVLPLEFADLAPLGQALIEAHVLTGRLPK
jgi:hypothetical protein